MGEMRRGEEGRADAGGGDDGAGICMVWGGGGVGGERLKEVLFLRVGRGGLPACMHACAACREFIKIRELSKKKK
jgi:hypothetical protein